MDISKTDIPSALSSVGSKAATVTQLSKVSGFAGVTEELRGAEILVKALQAEGVRYVWGYPGGAVLHIYDAFYKQDSISWFGTNRRRSMPLTGMPGRLGMLASLWSPLVLGLRMRLPGSRRRTWTVFRW